MKGGGAWEADFQQAYQEATSAEARQALEDGVISDREFAEMKARFAACLKDAGITLKSYGPGGSETAFAPPMTPDREHQKTSECSKSSGEDSVGMLYILMRSNPDNVDQRPAIVECFKRHGLVDASYTVKDYVAGDFTTDTDADRHAAFDACNSDPLGLLGG